MVANQPHRATELLREAETLRALADILDRKVRSLQAAISDGVSAEDHARITASIAHHAAEHRDLLERANRLEEAAGTSAV